MTQDFFGELGKRLSQTVEDVGKKTNEIMEQQRLRNQAALLNRDVRKHYQELGKNVYERYEEGEILDIEFVSTCESIKQKKDMIESCEEQIRSAKSIRDCESCGAPLRKDDRFCRRCGTLTEEYK